MVDIINLDDVKSAIENADYSNPDSIKDIGHMLNAAEASFAVSNQYDQFVALRKKYEEKLKAPESSPEKKASAEDDRKFDDIKGNQERREYLESKINQDGELNLSQNESAFLAEQIAKGEMYDNLKDGEKALKIAKALDVQSVADRAHDQAMAQLTKTQESYMAPTGSTYVANSEDTFGKQVLKDLDKADNKDKISGLENQANLLAANIEAYGYTSGNLSAQHELAAKMRELQESSKGILNFNTRRKLDAQLKKIDPSYYETKAVYANAVTRPYYKARIALRDRSENKTKKLEKRFEKVTELKDVINTNPFWSRHVGKNIAARAKLLGNCLAAGRLTANGVAKKYSKRLDITTSEKHLESIEAKISELKSNSPSGKRGREKLAAQLQMYESQKALFSDQIQTKGLTRKGKINAVKTQVSPAEQKVKERLEKMAQKLEATRVEDIKSSDRYKALMILKSNGSFNAEQKKEFDAIVNGLNEKKITGGRVYEEILRKEGFSDEQIKSKVEALFPAPEIEKAEKTEQTTEQNKEKEQKSEEATKLNSVVKSEKRENGEEVTTYASGLEVSKPNEDTYNISGKDGKSPTDEQCAEFAGQLKKDGFESFAMAENVSKEFYDSMVKAAEAQGLNIENKEAMDKKFAREAEAGYQGEEKKKDGPENTSAPKTTDGKGASEPTPKGAEKKPIDELSLTDKQKSFLVLNNLVDANMTMEQINKMQWKDLGKPTQMLLEKEGMGWQGTDRTEIKSGLAFEAHKLDIGLGTNVANAASPEERKKAEEKDVQKMATTLQKMSQLSPDMGDEQFKAAIKEFSPAEQKLATSIHTLQKAQAKKGENLSEEEKKALNDKTTRSIGMMVSKYKRSVEGKTSEKSKRTIARELSKQAISSLGKGKSNG